MQNTIMEKKKLVIRDVRFSYVHLFEKDSNDKYSVSLIIPKNSPQIQEIKAAISEAVRNGAAKLGTSFRLDINKVLHDGDIEKINDKAYANAYYLNAKSKRPVGIVKKNETGMSDKTIGISDPDEFYSGCYGAASIAFYAFNSGTNKGIGCAVKNVLKQDEGPRLDGGSSAESDFGGMIDEEDDVE